MPAAAAQTKPQSDHDTLAALNTDYINAVQHSDVRRFDEILSPDFYCSNPDGSLVDRAAFLRQTAQPVTIKNLKAEDVLIRVFSFAHDPGREPVPLLGIMRQAIPRSSMRARPTPGRTASPAAGATPTCGYGRTAAGSRSRRT
jgi:Domain of unknown function (DUF4440)